MFTEIRIYHEGHRDLSSGFSDFFEELKRLARERRCGFRLVSGGSRDDTCTDFGTTLKKHANAWKILLIDSEGPLVPKSSLSLCKTRKIGLR